MTTGYIQPTDQQGGFWSRLTPQRKQVLLIVGACLAFVVVTYPFLSNGPKTKKPVQSSLDNILTDADTHNLGMGGLSKQIDKLSAEVAELQKEREEGAQNKAVISPQSNDQVDALNKRISQMETELKNRSAQPPAEMPNVPGATTPGNPQSTYMQPNYAPSGRSLGQPQTLPPPPMRVRTIDQDGSTGNETQANVPGQPNKAGHVDNATAKTQAAVDKAYIPSGSIMSGVLITGLDAATGRSSTQDPIPVLIRLKHEAILPNRFRADYRECFMIAAGYGDLSSERAYLRAESISCVRQDGKVIDSKIEAYAVGEDGKAGMHGHLVSKQGQAIAKAAIAGFAQAYAQALQPNTSVGLGTTGVSLTGAGLQEGAYGGAGAALDRVAKFYIDMANQMFPVVEIDAGRPISMVAVKGITLALVQ